MDKLLDIKGLTVNFPNNGRPVKAVNDADLFINEGECVGLVGESGSGKSTLALAILRLIDPPGTINGEIKWQRKDLLKATINEMRDIRGKDISMVFQDPFSSLNPVYRVGEQVAEVFRVHKNLSRRKAWEMAVDALDRVHIKEPKLRAMDYPHQFSGGMKQRVAVAIAYALSPKLLIADEPTTALDVTMQKSVLDLLKELKTTLLFISHNVALVSGFCSRIYVMKEGEIVESGETQNVIKRPANIYTAKLVSSFREVSGR